uniref:SAM domain-containing protein n=1 Tax=Timema monikensis TaxID=170555 RepID=A0A7R9EF47_9NEOP|nr:unnamed protein product [Timema monikensis]
MRVDLSACRAVSMATDSRKNARSDRRRDVREGSRGLWALVTHTNIVHGSFSECARMSLFSCSLGRRGEESSRHSQRRASNFVSVERVFCGEVHLGLLWMSRNASTGAGLDSLNNLDFSFVRRDGTVDSMVDGTVNDTVDGTVDSMTYGTMDVTVDGTVNDTVDGTVDSMVYGTVVVTVTGTVNGTVDGVVDDTADSAVDDAADGTVDGLDNAVLVYIHSFLNNEVNGQQLLNLRPDDLNHLGVHKLGHQELILEAVEHLRNFIDHMGHILDSDPGNWFLTKDLTMPHSTHHRTEDPGTTNNNDSGNQEPSLHNMMVLLKTMQDTMEAIHHQVQ